MALNTWFVLCALVVSFIPSCHAPPIQLNEADLDRAMVAMTILRTIFLGYLAHIATIRPEIGLGNMNSILRKFQCFTFPTVGTVMAIKSIFYASNSEKILGIDRFKVGLQKFEEENATKYPPNAGAIGPPVLILPNYPDTQGSKQQHSQVNYINQGRRPEILRSNMKYLGDWLMEYLEKHDNIRIKKYDNGAYLAAFLHLIGPEKAKQIKHCILNRHVTLGFDSAIYGHRSRKLVVLTQNMTTTGPGTECEYQTQVLPRNVRYLSIDMISQLRTAYSLDNTAYMQVCVTICQVIYTTAECVANSGDKWTKSIMIIYTAMSILQTLSLVVLHKQSGAFSIYYDTDVPWSEAMADNTMNIPDLWRKVDLPPKDTERLSSYEYDGYRDLLYEGSYLQFMIERREFNRKSGEDSWAESDILLIVISFIIGVGIPLLICIWADYNAKSVTEWLVLSWISASAIFLLGILALKFNYHAFFVPMSIGFSILTIGSLGCVVTATVIGYLTE
ncbi:hypothetical protein CLU79DRAFT_740206 [Phycomyces nitens]|nr:hypothetical protein CLU79DRAFT_740206 [Phycomyces nitens]